VQRLSCLPTRFLFFCTQNMYPCRSPPTTSVRVTTTIMPIDSVEVCTSKRSYCNRQTKKQNKINAKTHGRKGKLKFLLVCWKLLPGPSRKFPSVHFLFCSCCCFFAQAAASRKTTAEASSSRRSSSRSSSVAAMRRCRRPRTSSSSSMPRPTM
jgi:hypothetical protein